MASRSRLLLRTSPVFLVAAVLAVTPITAAQREMRERHVTITALDKNDAPVLALEPTELTLREDGIAREIARVTRATGPMQIVLLADDSAAAQPLVKEQRQGLATFVDNIQNLNADTEIAIMTFGERPTRLADFTTSGALLSRAILQIFPRAGAGAYLLESINDATRMLKKKEAKRAVVVAFVVEDGPEFSSMVQDQVAKALQGVNAALWTIVLQGRSGAAINAQEMRERAAVVSDTATASGGSSRRVLDRIGLPKAFSELAAALGSQLDVAYSRPDNFLPPNKLEVTTKRPDVRIVAPRWAPR